MTTITPLPTVPVRTLGADTFPAVADTFMTALPTFATEMNTVAAEINAAALLAGLPTLTGHGLKSIRVNAAADGVEFYSFAAGTDYLAPTGDGSGLTGLPVKAGWEVVETIDLDAGASVETADMVDGYDYAIQLTRANTTSNVTVDLEVYQEGAAAYHTTKTAVANNGTSERDGLIELNMARVSSLSHFVHVDKGNHSGAGMGGGATTGGLTLEFFHGTTLGAQKIQKVRLSVAAGSFTGSGTAKVLRRIVT